MQLIKTQSYQIDNEFLQIDLISLFFVKATLTFTKSPLLLQKYLEVFRDFDGELNIATFKLLPLINNFNNTQDFIKSIKDNTLIGSVLCNTNYSLLDEFLNDLENNTLKIHYFKTVNGEKTALNIVKVLQEIFLPFINTQNQALLETLLNSSKYEDFKRLYLPYLTKQSKKKAKIKDLRIFCGSNLRDFGKRFFRLIFAARIEANLNDYLDLNRRYLNLTGIFAFQKDTVRLNIAFQMLLKHSRYEEILNKIANSPISQNLLSEYFEDREFIESFRTLGINPRDLKHYKRNLDKQKLINPLQHQFSKKNILEILKFFEDRKNDSKIHDRVTTEAKIPTIFEYIIAIVWCYIDENNAERILDAGLSLDSNMLPKSHAVGGNADFIYRYDTHYLMIEATLTQKSNQRRAEMESVSRHLGNLLLELDYTTQKQSYAIFIAPYLDKNVLNDFRSRIHCYYENETNSIKGMRILPLSTKDLMSILESTSYYKNLLPHFQALLDSTNSWGSKWYENEIKSLIEQLLDHTSK